MGVADLEELLRANLKLRGELAVEVAKAVEPVPLNHKILTMKRFDWWLNRLSPKGPLPWWSICTGWPGLLVLPILTVIGSEISSPALFLSKGANQ
jgi:hypothetical protein